MFNYTCCSNFIHRKPPWLDLGGIRMNTDWTTAAKARTDFADMLDELSQEQLAAETLCAGWTPLHIGGHIVSFVEMSLPQIMINMAKGGFNADKAFQNIALQYMEMGAPAIVQSLRANAAKTAPIKSFPEGLTVTDVAVHTQDIRRPLGLDGALDPDVVRASLDFCTTHKQGKMHVPTNDIAGLRLEATDMDWSWGSGAEVRGTGEALLLAINRRNVGDELEGSGVGQLPS